MSTSSMEKQQHYEGGQLDKNQEPFESVPTSGQCPLCSERFVDLLEWKVEKLVGTIIKSQNCDGIICLFFKYREHTHTIIKVINVVEINKLSTERYLYVLGPDILSLIHFCQSRGVYLAPGPLTIFRVSMTSSYITQI